MSTKSARDEIARGNETTCPEPPRETSNESTTMAGVAHEIGNLLTVVSGWVQCWEQTEASTPEGKQAARGVFAGLGRIRYSLNRFGASGPMARNLTVVDVDSVLGYSLSTLDPRVESGYKLARLAGPDPWPVVGDFWALDFVLVNLLMDAVAVSPPGSPILVKSDNVDAEEPVHGVGGFLAKGAYVSLSICYCLDDLGAESPRPVLPAEAPPSANRARENLPLCLRILEEHGGLLQIRESPYGESTVALFLPAVARCLPAEAAGAAPPEGWS